MPVFEYKIKAVIKVTGDSEKEAQDAGHEILKQLEDKLARGASFELREFSVPGKLKKTRQERMLELKNLKDKQ